MEYMPGEGIQPSVEEYLTRIAPNIAPMRPAGSYTEPMLHLDELLSGQVARERTSNPFELAERNIATFLARSPRPAVTVVDHRERVFRLFGDHSRIGWTRRSSTPLGTGWWIGAVCVQWVDPDDAYRSWSHRCAALLADGRIVAGLVTNMWFTDRIDPQRPPAGDTLTLTDAEPMSVRELVRSGVATNSFARTLALYL